MISSTTFDDFRHDFRTNFFLMIKGTNNTFIIFYACVPNAFFLHPEITGVTVSITRHVLHRYLLYQWGYTWNSLLCIKEASVLLNLASTGLWREPNGPNKFQVPFDQSVAYLAHRQHKPWHQDISGQQTLMMLTATI